MFNQVVSQATKKQKATEKQALIEGFRGSLRGP